MNDADEHELVVSKLSGVFMVDGVRLEVTIFRLDHEPNWLLEVVNEHGTSTVWDDGFRTEADAWAAFEEAVQQEGVGAFFADDESSTTYH